MKIKLHEIPEEGREYTYNRETAELNADLADLIHQFPYETKFFIKPLNNKDYEIKGYMKTHTKELCSLCGDTFKFKADATINEILIPKPQDDAAGHYAKPNHISEQDYGAAGVTEYDNEMFDVGEFMHQAIALVVPFNPKPDLNEKGDCSICLKAVSKDVFIYDEKMGDGLKPNPFEVLKGLKLNQ